MKKLAILSLVLALPAMATAGTMLISGLPLNSTGDAVLSFDVVSNGQLDNDTIYIWTTTGGTLSITGATNNIVPGEIYDDDPLNHYYLGLDYVDVANVTHPVIWADIAIPKAMPDVIVGDIISGLTLTIDQGFVGIVEVAVLSENSGVVEGSFAVTTPEPTTIAILAPGTIYLRRKK